MLIVVLLPTSTNIVSSYEVDPSIEEFKLKQAIKTIRVNICPCHIEEPLWKLPSFHVLTCYAKLEY
jgi:hypothetical protein